nr:hypothetical protein CFP56_08159 [Quercus suber]
MMANGSEDQGDDGGDGDGDTGNNDKTVGGILCFESPTRRRYTMQSTSVTLRRCGSSTMVRTYRQCCAGQTLFCVLCFRSCAHYLLCPPASLLPVHLLLSSQAHLPVYFRNTITVVFIRSRYPASLIDLALRPTRPLTSSPRPRRRPINLPNLRPNITMSSPSQPKRRRLNHAQALSRPFVSPVRREAKADTKTDAATAAPAALSTLNGYTPSVLAHSTTAAADLSSSADSSGYASAVSQVGKAARPARPSLATSRFSSSRLAPKFTPAEHAAQKALTALERELKATRNDVDALRQAQRLRASTADADLEALRRKWIEAAQAAAEEVFGEIKERVMRMGGVAAWKRGERLKFERSHGFGEFAASSTGFAAPVDDDADCEFDSAGEELPEAEQVWRKAEKAKARREREEAGDLLDELPRGDDGEAADGEEKEVWREEGEDDDVSYPPLLQKQTALQHVLVEGC